MDFKIAMVYEKKDFQMLLRGIEKRRRKGRPWKRLERLLGEFIILELLLALLVGGIIRIFSVLFEIESVSWGVVIALMIGALGLTIYD